VSEQPPAVPPPASPYGPAAPVVQDQVQRQVRRRSRLRRGLLLAGAISFIAICAIAVLVVIGFNIGVDALLIGLAAAIIPVPVLVLVFLWLDRYEPEPTLVLILCFAWGAFVATGLALAVNTAASVLFENIGLRETMVAVLVAPVIEEIGKAAFPLLLLIFRRRKLSGITDAIVYCGLSATGFAMVENILYLGGVGYRAGLDEFGPATGLFMLILIFIVRILLSGFAHPLFTSAAGVGIGLAARTPSAAVRWLAPIGGLLAAMLLHGTWNLMSVLSAERTQPLFFLYGYVAVMMPIFFGMVGLALWLRAREGRITQRTLPDYVQAGWLSPPEVASLHGLGARYSARRWARRVAGEQGVRAMRGFQFAATRLALLRDGVRRGLDASPSGQARAAAEEYALLQQIAALRAVYVGRDPAVPPSRWDGQRYEITFPDGSRRAVAAPPEPVMPLPVPLPPPVPVPAPLSRPPGVPPAPWHPYGYRQ
jgi:RsiW-degrading membrane proteinase PrsW (M82 family)